MGDATPPVGSGGHELAFFIEAIPDDAVLTCAEGSPGDEVANAGICFGVFDDQAGFAFDRLMEGEADLFFAGAYRFLIGTQVEVLPGCRV